MLGADGSKAEASLEAVQACELFCAGAAEVKPFVFT